MWDSFITHFKHSFLSVFNIIEDKNSDSQSLNNPQKAAAKEDDFPQTVESSTLLENKVG